MLINDKLKVCPFCQKKDGLDLQVNYEVGIGSEPKLYCDNCGYGMSFGFFGDGLTKDWIIDDIFRIWNTRG